MPAAANRRVRVAFFGAGDVSGLHAAALRRIPNAELAGIWSLPGCTVVKDPAAVASSYGCKLYRTPEELVGDPSVDAVLIHEHGGAFQRTQRSLLWMRQRVMSW